MFRGCRDCVNECADEVERVFLGGWGEVESTDDNEVLRLGITSVKAEHTIESDRQ